MDRQEVVAEVAAAALLELDKMEAQRIKRSSPREILEQVFKGMKDPQPKEENIESVSPLPVIPPQFPRLLASYRQKRVEYLVVNNFAEWAPYHDWVTVFPPQQCASRSLTTTLEAEVEKLKAAGLKERPKEDWQRRKELATK